MKYIIFIFTFLYLGKGYCQSIDSSLVLYNAKVLSYMTLSKEASSSPKDLIYAVEIIASENIYEHKWLSSKGFNDGNQHLFVFLRIERGNTYPKTIIRKGVTAQNNLKYEKDPPEPFYYIAYNIQSGRYYLLSHKGVESDFLYFFYDYYALTHTHSNKKMSKRNFLKNNTIEELDLASLFERYVHRFNRKRYLNHIFYQMDLK